MGSRGSRLVRGRRHLRLAALALGLGACARVEYDVADLQLDVEDPLPDAAETLHVCVEGAGELTQGAGNGRAAFTGIPTERPAVVVVEVYDVDGVMLGRTSPVELDATTVWRTTPLLDPTAEPCADAGERVPEGDEDWLLALRFAEEPPW